MPERTNGAVLKTAGPDEGLVGSNPTPPAVGIPPSGSPNVDDVPG
jgi:hypothetical protein